MFIVYSKETGKIKNIMVGSSYRSLKDLYPYDYKDYEKIYDFIEAKDDLAVTNNIDMFYIKDKKIKVRDEALNKYK